MSQERGPMVWVMVGLIMVVGLVVSRCRDRVPSHYRDLVVDQFHLPDDVEFVALSENNRRGRSNTLSAIVEFTPAQLDEYVRSLPNASVWTLEPYEFKGVTLQGTPKRNAMKWWSNSEAIITGPMALFWVDWSHTHSNPPDGGSDVWVDGPRKSFCYAVMGPAYGDEIVPCNSLPANGSRETLFADGQRPVMYVRALLDMTERRLFIYFRSNAYRGLQC